MSACNVRMTVRSHVSKRHVYCPMAMTGSFSADIQYGTFILPVFMDDVMFANNKPYGARVGTRAYSQSDSPTAEPGMTCDVYDCPVLQCKITSHIRYAFTFVSRS